MAGATNAAKYDALNFIHGTPKIAFYSAGISATVAAYTATSEVTSVGATPSIAAGGLALTGRTITASDGSVATAGVDYNDISFTPVVDMVFRYILVYDPSRSNRTIFWHDYGANQTASAGVLFTLTIPGTGTYVHTLA